MAAFQFPANPTLDQVYTANSVSFKWNGTGWVPFTANAITQQQAIDLDTAAITAHNADVAAHAVATGLLWQNAHKFISTAAPTVGDGVDGDFWFQRDA
jgi:hypothetical protein